MAWTDTAICYGHPKAAPDEAALLAVMDRWQVERAWIFGYDAVATHRFEEANARVLALAEKHPERFAPLGLLNPLHAETEVPRLIERGMAGIKLLTGWGNWISFENIGRYVLPMAEHAGAAGIPLIIAMEGVIPLTGGSLSLPLQVKQHCPKTCLVLDHLWSNLGWEDYLAFAREHPDVWLTLAGMPQRLLERALRELGPERVLLGSWYPETDTDLVTAQIERAWNHPVGAAGQFAENAARALEGRAAGASG
ncbi:MAG: amidohydrolase family protein [Rhodovibrionaceae bacterium]